MPSTFEVLLTPAQLATLGVRDLSQSVCVVFDVLRATTSMLAALGNGARRIYPVLEIAQALALRSTHPGALLAGEREGMRIGAGLTGGTDFDLGNSPREFTAERVEGKTIIMTTTNGTRALRACAGAVAVLLGGFVNLGAIAKWIASPPTKNLLLVCAGTCEEPAYEDLLAAGALVDLLGGSFSHVGDSVPIVRELFRATYGDLRFALERHSRNARRLLASPELRDDVDFCLQRDIFNFNAHLREGAVERLK